MLSWRISQTKEIHILTTKQHTLHKDQIISLKSCCCFTNKTRTLLALACFVHGTIRISQCWDATPTLGNLTVLGNPKSVLCEISSAFWITKEAKQSAHRRRSYICLLLNPEQSASQKWPNKKIGTSGQQKNRRCVWTLLTLIPITNKEKSYNRTIFLRTDSCFEHWALIQCPFDVEKICTAGFDHFWRQTIVMRMANRLPVN